MIIDTGYCFGNERNIVRKSTIHIAIFSMTGFNGAVKMKEYENDGLGYGIFEKVDKDLGLSRGTACDASGYKDYADFVVFNDV